jgi:two-component system chemotaxis response regulator CheB
MGRVRVLVVDDSAVARRVVSEELAGDPTLEVAGTASNGRIALARMPALNPDVVLLDVEMPEMDGLATLAELRKSYPRLPVIMFSSLTERGAAVTLDALALGASDYVTKPDGGGGPEAARRVLREALIPKIKSLCKAEPAAAVAPAPRPFCPAPTPRRAARVQCVAVGASTGGPNALADLFAGLPGDLPVPLLIVQHMPPMFTRLLAERLTARHPLRVEEGGSGVLLRPGQAWIAPGDYHMVVAGDAPPYRLLLHQEPPENSCRPAVDVLFRSVARAFGPGCLGVVLTGMGQDGLRGCEAIREAGGQVLAQDEASSVVWGMPGYVARAGLADRVLPLSVLASEIRNRVSARP